MHAREQRRSVLIPARLRVGARWIDARILNISSRGLMLHTGDPPPRGSYLEVRRGGHTIVARVMWAEDGKLGVRSQDVIAAEALIRDLDPVGTSFPVVERRAAPRSRDSAHETSRWRGRSVEFIAIAMFGAVLGAAAFDTVAALFARPLAAVGEALG